MFALDALRAVTCDKCLRDGRVEITNALHFPLLSKTTTTKKQQQCFRPSSLLSLETLSDWIKIKDVGDTARTTQYVKESEKPH